MTSPTPATRAGTAPISTLLGIGRAPARRVHAHAAERIGPPADDDARLGLHLLRGGQKGAVDACRYSAPRAPARARERGVERVERARPRRARHLERLERRRVELAAPARAARRRPRAAPAR